MNEQIHEAVRTRYAAAALQVQSSPAACCAEPGIGAELYTAAEREALPDAAVLASLGCGNPTAVADLREGERVLDLGSGGGIDVLLSAQRVGPDRPRLRARHDRRDAGPRTPQCRGGRRDERGVPQGSDRGDPPAGGLDRRR